MNWKNRFFKCQHQEFFKWSHLSVCRSQPMELKFILAVPLKPPLGAVSYLINCCCQRHFAVAVEVLHSAPSLGKKGPVREMIGLTTEEQTLRRAWGSPLLICCDDVLSLSSSAPCATASAPTHSFLGTKGWLEGSETFILCFHCAVSRWKCWINPEMSQLVESEFRCLFLSQWMLETSILTNWQVSLFDQ